MRGREQILNVHRNGKPLVMLTSMYWLIAPPRFTGADLSNLINEAALIAARANKREIEMVDMEQAIEQSRYGAERRTRLIPPKEKK